MCNKNCLGVQESWIFIKIIYMDRQFELLRGNMNIMQIKLNVVSNIEHSTRLFPDDTLHLSHILPPIWHTDQLNLGY